MPRRDSLFARLLLAQVLLALLLALVFGVLFYVERNVTIANLYADRWAPQLAAAAGLAAAPRAPLPVLRRDAPPPLSHRPSAYAPRFIALRRALAAQGVPVGDIRVGLGSGATTIWLQVQPPGGAPQWLGVAGQLAVPEWSRRSVLALLLAGALLVAVSWSFTRRLTRPLEQLRARMQSHTPGARAAPGAPAASAAPEIVAIDAAYGELLARLEQHERERAVLLAGISHDLRSPLGRIRMAAELLPDGTDVAPRKAAIVRNIADADRLIGSFLDYVRAGELAFDETVDLADAARAAAAAFDRPRHELAVDAPGALPWPQANRLLVERLVANLVDNALKHGRPPVRVSVGAARDAAWIEVEDGGAGIAPEQAAALQQAFARGDRSRGSAGTGLGLAIVRQVAARLGATVSFDRVDGRHRVRVTLAKR